MAKIVIKENGELKYKKVDEEKLALLKNEIEEIVNTHKLLTSNTYKITISVTSNNGGRVIINVKTHIEEYTTTESICNICSTNFGEEELSIKEAIALNITLILDNLVEVIERDNKHTN